jgi:hypothetical protein
MATTTTVTPDVILDDVTIATFTIEPFCTNCPPHLSNSQHTLLHNLLLELKIATQPFTCKHYRPKRKTYQFKTQEILILHELGFCTTNEQCIAISKKIRKLIDDIDDYLRNRKPKTKHSNLRI